jgi:hypothetical protein
MTFAAFLTMRALHRPIHNKFIFSDKWDTMSEKEKEEALKDGKIKIPRKPEEFKTMKGKEIEELRRKVRPIFEEIKNSFLSLLKEMPKSLLLVTRYFIS